MREKCRADRSPEPGAGMDLQLMLALLQLTASASIAAWHLPIL